MGSLDDLRRRFDEATVRAARRCRWQRVLGWLPRWAWAGAGGFVLLTVAALIFPAVALYGVVLGGVWLVLWLGALGVLMGLPVSRQRALGELDRHAQLADGAVSAMAWCTHPEAGWQEAQLRQTVTAVEAVDWPRQWPLSRPRRAILPLVGVVALAVALVGLERGAWHAAQAASALAAKDSADTAEEAAALEDVFEDWDKAAAEQDDPQLQELLAELQPLREKLEAGELDDRELFLELNRVQDKLAAMQEQLDRESLEPMAGDMAEALEPLDGAGALSAALRRKDFEAAKKQAEELQKQFSKGQKPMPAGNQADQAGRRMQQVAGKFGQRGNQGMQRAMKSMGQGAQQGNRSQMCQGMQGMAGQLGQESSRQQQRQARALQMAQMNAAKQELGKKAGTGQCQMAGVMGGMKKLSELGKSPGSGAGSEADANKFGDPTEMESERLAAGLTGQIAGDGPTEVSLEKSQQLQMEQTGAGVSSAEFAAYEQMSRQAVQDENLPVAHRQMIKAYFEGIRPQSSDR